MNKESINLLIQELIDNASKIMEKSFPLCKDANDTVSISCSKINNSAFVIKQKSELLKKELSIKD